MRGRWALLAFVVAACMLFWRFLPAGSHLCRVSPPPEGYRMPAEFEPHKATWLSWPHTFELRARKILAQMVDALQEGEEVHILVNSESELENAVETISKYCTLDNVFFHTIEHDDMWIRDYGPIFIDDGVSQACVDWPFDGWGGREPYERDDLVPRRIARILGIRCYVFRGFVLEGGAIDVNGKGVCLTSDSLLNPKIRSPAPTRQEVEQALRKYLGIRRVIWLEGYLPGDIYTYGHVDSLARFVNANTIVASYQPDPNGPGYEVLERNYRILLNAVDQDGNPFKVVRIPVSSDPKYPSSYVNFYIGNEVVLVPVYNDPRDEEALSIIRSLFPGRRVVALDCSWLTLMGGEIHCITLQQPKVGNSNGEKPDGLASHCLSLPTKLSAPVGKLQSLTQALSPRFQRFSRNRLPSHLHRASPPPLEHALNLCVSLAS